MPWDAIGQIVGDQGPQGVKGDTGDKGDKGDTGDTGPGVTVYQQSDEPTDPPAGAIWIVTNGA